MNLLRNASLVLAAGAALCWVASGPAQAKNRLQPHWYAYSILYDYGSTYDMYEHGCVKWNYRNQSWYTHCGLPQNAVLVHPHVLRVRD